GFNRQSEIHAGGSRAIVRRGKQAPVIGFLKSSPGVSSGAGGMHLYRDFSNSPLRPDWRIWYPSRSHRG
ncbi:MAG: hypothetical protein LW690_16195, partial [Opitutaceae bacterium]|nr:hypothetical protein [Opitutaceae bacterium]